MPDDDLCRRLILRRFDNARPLFGQGFQTDVVEVALERFWIENYGLRTRFRIPMSEI